MRQIIPTVGRIVDLTRKPASSEKTLTIGRNRDSIAATDGELLMRFVQQGDHRAFAEIVQRHGGLVWIVCREVLGHHQDVEDAFQATFFILAERAHSIQTSDSAAAWLYKVAQRTAFAARRKRLQRREEELATDAAQADDEPPVSHDRHMICVLMEELRELPERYQVPLVMRYLEGRSRRTIAEQTDSTLAQIQGRLVRGRRLLRTRLLRRRVALSVAVAAMASATAKAHAIVTPALAVATAESCVAVKAGSAVVGISAAAVELAKQGAKAMWLASMTKTAAAVSGVLLAAGIAWGVQAVGSGGKDTGQAKAAAAKQIEVVVAGESNDNPQTGDALLKTGKGDWTTSATINVTAKSADDPQANVKRAIADVRESIDKQLPQQIATTKRVEKLQIEKSLLQRELDQVHMTLVDLQLTSDDGATDEQRVQREKRRAELSKRLESVKERLEDNLNTGVEAKTGLERSQLELKRLQDRLSQLELVEMKLQFGVEQGSPTTITVAERPVAVDPATGISTGVVRGISGTISDAQFQAPPAPQAVTIARNERVLTSQDVESAKPSGANLFLSNTASFELLEAETRRLELEQQSWMLKAKGYAAKAQAMRAVEKSIGGTPTAAAEAMLVEADANHAESMAEQLNQQLKLLRKQMDREKSKPKLQAESTDDLKKQLDELKNETASLREQNSQLKEKLDKVSKRIPPR